MKMKLLSTLLIFSLLGSCSTNSEDVKYSELLQLLSDKIPYELDLDDTNLDTKFVADTVWDNSTLNRVVKGKIRGTLSFSSREMKNVTKRFLKEYEFELDENKRLSIKEITSMPLADSKKQ